MRISIRLEVDLPGEDFLDIRDVIETEINLNALFHGNIIDLEIEEDD